MIPHPLKKLLMLALITTTLLTLGCANLHQPLTQASPSPNTQSPFGPFPYN